MNNPRYNREQSEAALAEFGFAAVEITKPGAPTPGRIADRISDVLGKYDRGRRDEAIAELRRLLFALDSYDGFRMEKCRA